MGDDKADPAAPHSMLGGGGGGAGGFREGKQFTKTAVKFHSHT